MRRLQNYNRYYLSLTYLFCLYRVIVLSERNQYIIIVAEIVETRTRNTIE